MRLGRIAIPLLLAGALLAPAAAPAQSESSEYERRYGPIVDVSLSDLLDNSLSYEGRAVRTRGRLDLPTDEGRRPAGGGRVWWLTDSFNAAAVLVAVPEISYEFDREAMRWVGQTLQVTAVVQRSSSDSRTRATLNVFAFEGPADRQADKKAAASAPRMTLEALVASPGRRDGQMVRVVGRFRGRNLYGDLPVRSQKSTQDWVIKDDVYAVWVSGKKAKGSGWELDAALKRDTGKWIEVVGRPETVNGVTYLKAVEVALTTEPRPQAKVEAPPPPPERPKKPPVVVFALPMDGDQDVPSDSRFVVQFSKDMDEETFGGRVQLRYAGPQRPGDRVFDAVKLIYDRGRRALTVDPGDALRPGRRLELLFLPGIADIDGLTLQPRRTPLPDAVDVLRFDIGT